MKQMRALKYIWTNKNGKQTSKTYFTVKDLFIWNGWHANTILYDTKNKWMKKWNKRLEKKIMRNIKCREREWERQITYANLYNLIVDISLIFN